MSDESGRPSQRRRQDMRSPHKASTAAGRERLKISSRQNTAPGPRSAAGHARLHTRASSVSSTSNSQNAAFPSFDPDYRDDIVVPPAAYCRDHPSPVASPLVKIKPLLKRIATQEKASLDLSRSAAENEGLGIYTSSSSSGVRRRGSDVGHGASSRYHARTISGTSQVSTTTTSSTHRHGAHYVHPMRQTPRPFTPPHTHSYQNSLANSEISSIRLGPTIEDTSSPGPTHYPAPVPYASLPPSTRRSPPPLHIRTYSNTRLNTSQTNLPGTPSSLRFHGTFAIPTDTMMHTARSSFDSVFRKRSRTNTVTDPAVELAAVQALRAEFNAREAAKDVKIQQAHARVQEKQSKKQERREEEIRRKEEALERKRAKGTAASEKSVVLSTGEYNSAPSLFPVAVGGRGAGGEKGGRYGHGGRGRKSTVGSAGKAGKAVSSHWSLFWFRFKTMWLRFKRTVGRAAGQKGAGRQ